MGRKITVVVETGKDNFGCFMSSSADDLDIMLVGAGKTARKCIEDFYASRDEMKAFYEREGRAFPDLEFDFVFDVGAFFSYYPINVSAFASYTGMSASSLRQYACGLRTPSAKTLERIRQGIDAFKKDIVSGKMIDRPVLQYV